MIDQAFELWLESLSQTDVLDYLYDVYIEDIVQSADKKLENIIKFHRESILKYDDRDVAQLSLEILQSIDLALIDLEIKKRCKTLGIKYVTGKANKKVACSS